MPAKSMTFTLWWMKLMWNLLIIWLKSQPCRWQTIITTSLSCAAPQSFCSTGSSSRLCDHRQPWPDQINQYQEKSVDDQLPCCRCRRDDVPWHCIYQSHQRSDFFRASKDLPDIPEKSWFKVYEPSGNFMLVRILKDDLTSQDLFDRAIREKMMIRDCSTFPF